MMNHAAAFIIPDLKFDYPKSYENWKNYLENFEIEKMTQPLPKSANNQEKYYANC